MGNNEIHGDEQLPLLDGIRQQVNLAPEGYFEKLPDRVIDRIKQPGRKRLQFEKQMYVRLLAAAAIIAGLWLSIDLLFIRPNTQFPALTQSELEHYSGSAEAGNSWEGETILTEKDLASIDMDSWIRNLEEEISNSDFSVVDLSKDEIINYILEAEFDQLF